VTRPRGRPAFTLIEVLATIGVLALLMGLLLPVLARTREGARSARCMANLRQMAVAAQQYALRYQHFPPAVRYERDGGFRQVAWDWVTTFSGDLVSPGALWSFADDPGTVHQCPSYHGPSTSAGDPHTGYNYNTTYLGGESPFPATGWEEFRPGVTFAACRRAPRCAMFGDGGWAGGANKFMRAPLNSEGAAPDAIYAGGQAFRHAGATNVAYVDGHVGASDDPRPGEHASDLLLERVMDHPRNGFLSDDDSAYAPR
jgi:prepilin-type processing-associated H-X9-DG protein/prepilin-type N-terminal cleavage/methylation domain-containing protein